MSDEQIKVNVHFKSGKTVTLEMTEVEFKAILNEEFNTTSMRSENWIFNIGHVECVERLK